MGRRRIAITGVDVWAGGAGGMAGSFRVVYELARQLSKRFEVTLIVLKDGEPASTDPVGVEGFRTLECSIGRPPGAEFPRGFLSEYDLLQIWGASRALLHKSQSDGSLPHCYSFHSSLEARGILARLQYLFDPHDRITVAGKGVRDYISSECHLPVEAIPLGVDTDRFRPMGKESCRELLGIPKEAFVFGFLGRLWKFDFGLTYRAFKRVKALSGRKDCVLVAAGQYDRLRMRGPRWVKDDFLILSSYPHSEVPSILNSFDVLLNTPCGVREGFGLSVLEAMACGVPVISVAWDGFKETVVDGETGLLVDTAWHSGEPWIHTSQLVDACVALLKQDALRAEMGRKARDVVSREFTWGLFGQRYAKLFEAMIDEAACSSSRSARRSYDAKAIERLSKSDTLGRNVLRAVANLPSSHRIGGGWERTVSDESIDFLPKYRQTRDSRRGDYHERLRREFPFLRQF